MATAQTSRTEGRTAEEVFQKYGEISRISKAYFNRYKGTEWYFEPRMVDGQRVVLGWLGSHPDTGEISEFCGEAIMAPFADFCSWWDQHARTKNIYDVVAAMKAAGAVTMSIEKYRAVLDTGQALPRCKHCNQTIL